MDSRYHARNYAIVGILSFIVTILVILPDLPVNVKMVEKKIATPAVTEVKQPPIDMVQLDCLARNIFFEARGESARGKAMVGFVVLQRVQSPHFPKTICGVVRAGRYDLMGRVKRNQCAFSWFCDGRKDKINFHDAGTEKEWEESYLVAKLIMLGKIKPSIDMKGVTHYHTNKVHPFWASNKNYILVARVGAHLFYRWKKATLPVWHPVDKDTAIAMN